MPTHLGRCRVCGTRVGCADSAHSLSAGRHTQCHGGPRSQTIQFCSAECFVELWSNMRERLEVCREVEPELAQEVDRLLAERAARAQEKR